MSKELCEWLRENSSGIYRKSADAADLIEELEAKIASCDAEIAELRKDAERYQWLTRHAYIGECYAEKGKILEVSNTDREVPMLEYTGFGAEKVNQAIDAAIAREKQ